jgi:hypothetical protein
VSTSYLLIESLLFIFVGMGWVEEDNVRELGGWHSCHAMSELFNGRK